jgi:hypothetical protein
MARLTNTTIYGAANVTGNVVTTGYAFDISANNGVNISNANTISSVVMLNNGSQYLSVPSIIFSAPTTGGATANANAVMRFSGTITAGNVGSGYANGDILYANVAGALQNAWFTVTSNTATTYGAGGINGVSVGSYGLYFVIPPGSNTVNPYITITGTTSATGVGANLQSFSGMAINNVYFQTTGSGYVEQPTVTISGGSPNITAVGYATVGSATNVKFLGGLGTSATFSTPSGSALQFYDGGVSTPSALVIKNGSAPQLYPSINNTDLYLSSSGTGSVRFMTNAMGYTQLLVTNTTSAVNFLNVTGNVTTKGPVISSNGSDANIDINITPKGTGNVNINSANTIFSGNVTVANTTASTSNTTGAVVISGGLGVAGNVYANGIYTSGLFYAANGNPISGGGTSLAYTAATTPPASGNNKGDQWYNTTTNVLYEWATDGTSYFWIDTSSPTVSNTSNIAINITGNINVGIVFANTVIANVNSTIIYSNTISVTGNVNANIIFANTITANFIGNGSQLSGLTASQIPGLYSNTNLSSYLSSTNIATSAITNTGNLITGNLTVTGSANFVTNSNSALAMTINNLAETVNLQTTVGQTLVNFYVAQQSIMLNTTPATANMTLNITGHPSGATLNTLLGVGQSITVAYGFTNGATTGYYISQLQIDGTNITPKYTGGNSQTGGDPSAVDMYTWTIIKTASTPTYNVFASNTKYA